MNILFYFENQINPIRGGTERVAWLISNYLHKQGHNIFYMARYPVEDERSVSSSFLPEQGNGKTNIDFVNRFIRENNIQIIINEGGNTDDVYLFSHQNIPTYIKIITCLHFDITGDLDYFYQSYSCSLANLSFQQRIKKLIQIIRLPYLKRYHIRKRKERYRFLYLESDQVVLLCNEFIHVYKQFAKITDDSKLTALINPNTFEVKENVEVKKNNIIYVGRITFSPKRVDRILKIWKIVEPQFPDWNLTLIGDGDYRAKAELFVVKHHLKQVKFAGFTDAEPYYREAKFLLLTSNFEGTPMVIPEAMAYGAVPIVMNSFLGATVHIKNGYNGCLTDSFNIKKTAEALSSLMKDESLRIQMAQNGKESIKAFDIESVGKKWEELLQQIYDTKK
jgi:glycosyltransferase involved in cell wall biosynthesis